MKSLLLITGLLCLGGYAIGQAKDGTADLQKTVSAQPAASIYLPYSPEVVKKSLDDYLSKTSNQEEKNAKGYLLSSNTLLVKNQEGNADMHFVIDRKSPDNKNETVVYLKLNSSFQTEQTPGTTRVQFNMQDAKDYLNNLALAIKPYATDLQLKLQRKNLSDAQDKNNALVVEGNKLEEQRKKIQVQVDKAENSKNSRKLAKRKEMNDRLINENLVARGNLSNDITQQMAALALLTD